MFIACPHRRCPGCARILEWGCAPLSSSTSALVEDTGAGDIFAACFFHRLQETNDPWEAARFAVQLAACSVTRRHFASIPTQQEISNARMQVIWSIDMGKVYSIVNQKGGVGKTTTSINLGAYLGQLHQKVLLVDLDPQANATSCLGIDKNSITKGTYEVLIGAEPAQENILHNAHFMLSLLPSSPNLAGAEIELIEFADREKKLKKSSFRCASATITS